MGSLFSYRTIYLHTGQFTYIQDNLRTYKTIYLHAGQFTYIQYNLLTYRTIYLHTGQFTYIPNNLLTYKTMLNSSVDGHMSLFIFAGRLPNNISKNATLPVALA